MSINLFEKYIDTGVGTINEYFQFIDKLKYYFLGNGVSYNEEFETLKIFLENFKNNIDERSYENLVEGFFHSLNVKKDEIEFIDKYIIPELFKYGLDIIIYESNKIYFGTFSHSLNQPIKMRYLIDWKKCVIYGNLYFSTILRETTKINMISKNFVEIEMKIKDNRNKIINQIKRLLIRDLRLYEVLKDIIQSYLQNIDSEVVMNAYLRDF